MPFATAKDGTEIFYIDWGSGPVVFFSHGWPLDADMWDQQMVFLAEQGYRVIAHDRRGFGRSGQPWSGYDYDTFADDIGTILDTLDVFDVTLVGFSMGGGDVARYISRSGGKRVTKACLTSAVTPYFIKADDNPDGVELQVFDGIRDGLRKDRPQFLLDFNPVFYGASDAVSEGIQAQMSQIAFMASLKATLDCVGAFSQTDFRPDMAAFTMPTLIIHGDNDQVVPIATSGQAAHAAIPHSVFKVYEGAPHALTFTEQERYNADLLEFLQN